MAIPFTQYLRPNGRQKPITIERPEVIEGMANVVIEAEGRFTIEALPTGEASLICEFNEADIACEVCPNGPGIEAAVDRLVKTAYKHITDLEPPGDTPS